VLLPNETITAISGIKVGHAEDPDALTGCTVILLENGAVGGVDQRGGAPGTRETDLLHPMHLVEQIHAILLTGGSAYGLDAATGVMRYLEERKIGFNTGVARVPIVPSAVLFDLAIGQSTVRPDAEMGYLACQHATTQPVLMGNVGAGCGASVGKILGITQATKTGLGSACLTLSRGVKVAAIVAVNAFGDVVDPNNGKILAGTRTLKKGPLQVGEDGPYADTLQVMKTMIGKAAMGFATRGNTVIGLVATNARLTKEEVNKVAQMAQDGLARTLRPAHTMLDGDTIFAVATGAHRADVSTIGACAAEVVAQSILNGVMSATPAGGLPAASGILQEINQ
jgi:L-aminopeptidase/D-esterase-like protein